MKRSRVFRVVESGNCHLESSSILKRNFYINCSSRKKFANGRDRPFLIFAQVSCKIGSFVVVFAIFKNLLHEYREAHICTPGNCNPRKGIWTRVDYRKRNAVLSGHFV